MFSNNWMNAGALILGIGVVAIAVKMIFDHVINKESGPGGAPPGSTE